MPKIDDGEIKPPIEVEEVKEAPKGGALLVKALDELLFDEDFPVQEKMRVLTKLNHLFSENPDRSRFPVYIEFDARKLREACTEINKYLPKNIITDLLIQQKNLELYHFIAECKQKNITNLIIGGVYGDACVWDQAIKIAKNIYARNLGLSHPNCRYKLEHEDYQFENAIISPELISLGQVDEEIRQFVFDNFLCFSQTQLFCGFYDDINEKIAAMPDKLGAVYQEEASNPEGRIELEKFIKRTLSLARKEEKSPAKKASPALFNKAGSPSPASDSDFAAAKESKNTRKLS